MRIKGTLVALLLALLLLAVPGYATTLIDFSTDGAGLGGVVTVSGGNAIGVNIPLGDLLVAGAPLNNGSFALSGPASGSTLANVAALDFNTSTGTISVVGGVPALGIATPTTLLTGTISSFTITSPSSVQLVVDLVGPDTKGAPLLTALGLPTDTHFQYYTSDINFIESGGVWEADSTDISNTSVIPEPASIALFGSGLLGLAGFARRRFLI
jgi:hypothetical protein